jgi:energy-coupling factor transporter ATP-binding protein EcfA2
MEHPAIDVRGLVKRFGDLTAVDDISFTVQPGTITALLGGNGAGKTTTISMLLGLLLPTAGSITVVQAGKIFVHHCPYFCFVTHIEPPGSSCVAIGFFPLQRFLEAIAGNDTIDHSTGTRANDNIHGKGLAPA